MLDLSLLSQEQMTQVVERIRIGEAYARSSGVNGFDSRSGDMSVDGPFLQSFGYGSG